MADRKDTTRVDDGPGAPQAAQAGRIHLIIGPVGAGKSTFAVDLARTHRALRFSLDAWMTGLFSPDRPAAGVVEWYVERAARCVERICASADEALALGTDVVLEIGLLRRDERDRFYRRAAAAGFDVTVYVVDAPREVRRARVERRNRERGATFSMVVPPAVFELASDLWEPPDDDERGERDTRAVFTDAS